MRPTRDWVAVDAVTAAALMAASQLEIWAPRLVPGVGAVVGNRLVLAVTSVLATAPLAVRRRWPVTALLAVLGALVVQQLLTTPTDGLVLLITAMVAAYSSSAYTYVRHGVVSGVAIAAGAALMGDNVGDWAFIAVVVGGAWVVGFVVMKRSAELMRAREDNRSLAVRLAEAAHQLAQAQSEAGAPFHEHLAVLTAREVEVARTIARGLSNAEIARALFISEWTVKTHVASILRKLELRDRAQIVIAAYESQLVTPGNAEFSNP